MKTPIIPVLSATALAVVSCTSLPGDISAGIKNGNPHAYYEAGKHIDDSKTAGEAPPLLQLVCLPINIPLAILSAPRMESCFFYRNHDSKNKEAAEYYRKGAELGDADCMYEMGRNYEKGWGVEENATIAWSYYTQAAQKGSSAARNKVAAQSPASIAGKTIVFDYSNADSYERDFDSSWKRTQASHGIEITTYVSTRNTRRGQGYDVGDGHYLAYKTADNQTSATSYDYKKTGIATAEIVEPGYEWETTYTLTFDSATTGTVTTSGGGEGMEWKASGIRFTIK